MKYIFYDTETTGLTRADEVIQFGMIVTNERLVPIATEMFYCYTQVPISKKAQELCGISAKDLRVLSAGRTFEDSFLELPIIKEDSDVIWVSYSTNGFDERLVNQTLSNNGLPKYNFGQKIKYFNNASTGKYLLDAYNALRIRCYNGRDQRLSQVVNSLNIPPEKVNAMFKTIVPEHAGNFHDALFDAYSLWLSVYVNRERLGFELC